MISTRVLIRHKTTLYRFVRVRALPDGSLIVLIDRNKSRMKGHLTFRNESLFKNPGLENELVSHSKWTCHTTGQINYYANAASKPDINFFPPLFELSKATFIGFYSIPNAHRLDAYNCVSHSSDNLVVIEIPEEIDERLTFVIEMLPLNLCRQSTFGVVINYELYALEIRLESINFPQKMANHFIDGMPSRGDFESRQIGIPEAEIGFHKMRLNGIPPLFRGNNGQYIMLTEVPMRCPPKLRVAFKKVELSIEQIMPEGNSPATHKVKFWIKDKGGRNKCTDLRDQILSIVFDSRM